MLAQERAGLLRIAQRLISRRNRVGITRGVSPSCLACDLTRQTDAGLVACGLPGNRALQDHVEAVWNREARFRVRGASETETLVEGYRGCVADVNEQRAFSHA